jgi:hypothetical protein
MIPRSKAIDWSDPEVGDRMHLIPYSVLSDPNALAVEVFYVRDGDYYGQFHRDGPDVFVTVRCGLDSKQRRQAFWHELAHVLDLSEMDPSYGNRTARKSPRFSACGGTLEPLLENYLDVLNMDPMQFAGFDVFSPPRILPYSDWYSAGADDPVELFARAVVISVSYPVEAKRVMPDLHEEIAAILYREMCLKIPKKTVARFHWRLMNGNWRKFPVVNGVEIGTKRRVGRKKSKT